MILDSLKDLTVEIASLVLPSVAASLFNDHLLIVDGKKYRMLEIEFYIKAKDHNDLYTHGHKRQCTQGEWYCHPSGLDITIGNNDIQGGILIRSIGELKDLPDSKNPFKTVVIGPIKCLTEIFSAFGTIDNQKHIFYLHDNKTDNIYPLINIPIRDIIATPRIGLNPDINVAFHQMPYRYLIYPRYGHKNKKQIAECWFRQLDSDPAELPRIRNEMGSEFLKQHYTNAHII